MYIAEIMNRKVALASPDDSLQAVAALMCETNCGIVPIEENDRLVGMVTDRDITTRAVARGENPNNCKIRNVMSSGIKFVYEYETVDDVQRNMSRLCVRRLPVLNRSKRLVGIVSLGDIAITQADEAGLTLSRIAQTARHRLASNTESKEDRLSSQPSPPIPLEEGIPTHIAEIMHRKVALASPDDSLQAVAALMCETNCGSVPIEENDRLVGMVTDRDITTRAVARGENPNDCKVRNVMSGGIKFVYEDETVDDVQRNMSRLCVRRLPVLNRSKRLVGIVSLGDIAITHADRAGLTLSRIANAGRRQAIRAAIQEKIATKNRRRTN